MLARRLCGMTFRKEVGEVTGRELDNIYKRRIGRGVAKRVAEVRDSCCFSFACSLPDGCLTNA